MHRFPSFEWPTVQIWIFRRNSNKRTKSTRYCKHSYNCPQMIHVGLHSVGTYHKKFGSLHSAKKTLCRVPTHGSRQRLTAISFGAAADSPLPSAAFADRRLCRVFNTRQTCLCRVVSCAECPALGKEARCREPNFTECGSRQSLLCRVPTKGTRQRCRHSAKPRIPVVIAGKSLSL
jgi:hypothetical protein